MAQDTVISNKRFTERHVYASNPSVTVAQAGLTTILEVPEIADTVRCFCQIDAGSQALDAFEIQVKVHPDGDWVALYNASGDFTTPAGLLVGASGDLTGLALSTTGWFIMETRGLYGIRLQASCDNAAGSVCDVYFAAG
jgi:hypothetical protein